MSASLLFVCEKHVHAEVRGCWRLVFDCSADTHGLTVPASFNNNRPPPLVCRCGRGKYLSPVPLLMKVLWLDSGKVESLRRSMRLISASLMRLWTPVGGEETGQCFPQVLTDAFLFLP